MYCSVILSPECISINRSRIFVYSRTEGLYYGASPGFRGVIVSRARRYATWGCSQRWLYRDVGNGNSNLDLTS